MTDLAIVNARVWTGDPAQPEARALAVRDGRIVAVGADAEIASRVGPHTRVIQAGGRRVVPGFNDAHVHLLEGGFSLREPPLRQARDEGDFLRMIAERAAGLPAGKWITGGHWDHEGWPSRRRPTRELVDPVTPDHPALLSRIDGHIALANSLALSRAGITADTPDPPGGRIERDEHGRPTGIVIDAAKGLVDRAIPPPDAADRLQAVRAAVRYLNGLGVTSVHASMSLAELELWQDLRRQEELTVRVYAMLYLDAFRQADPAWIGKLTDDPFLHSGAVKLFADGSLGAGSALFFEPYDDNPSSVGLAIHPERTLYEIVREVDASGMQVALHAIGDKAVHWALNAFQRAARANGRRDSRHRVEHAQLVRPADRRRLARLGAVASIQPSHCIDDMRWVAQRMGGRTKWAYPFRSLLQAGAHVTAGSDWPVESPDPMLTLYAAVSREYPAGGPAGGWHGRERVSVEQALEACTLGAAWAEFREHQKGSIQPGKLADVVILSDDVLSIPPPRILQTRAELTIVGGRVVYDRGATEQT